MKSSLLLPVVLFVATTQVNALDAIQNTTQNQTITIALNENERTQKDAIEIILQQHKYIKEQFSRLDKLLNTNIEESRSLYNELKDFLVKHETMEQKEWYPELEKIESLKEIVSMLKEEEKSAADAIKDIDSTKDNKEWIAKVRKLKKGVEDHARDEETKLFPKVKQTVDMQKLLELGRKLGNYVTVNNMKY